MRVTSESVEEWDDAPGRRGDGEGILAGEFGWDAGATFVRHENLSEPGRWYGELGGTGTRRTKTFCGKRGDRKQMYFPQHARIRIVLQSWSTNSVYGLTIGMHHDMLYNLILRQEPFLLG